MERQTNNVFEPFVISIVLNNGCERLVDVNSSIYRDGEQDKLAESKC